MHTMLINPPDPSRGQSVRPAAPAPAYRPYEPVTRRRRSGGVGAFLHGSLIGFVGGAILLSLLALALLLFFDERYAACAAAATALVLVKETAITTPMVFAAWLWFRERRRKEALYFLGPAIALGFAFFGSAGLATVGLATAGWAGCGGATTTALG